MASNSRPIDEQDFEPRAGNDSPPLMNNVQEPPPSHWGKRTSSGRFESEAYLRFFYGKKHKEVRRDK
jgi:hypothetical protein